jgi:uncharacterized protein (DUF2164 family)
VRRSSEAAFSRARIAPGRKAARAEEISMATDRSRYPMRIKLTDERRALVLLSVKRLFAEQFDEEISDFRAEGLLDFFVKNLGPPVYNQAIRDALGFMQDKMMDLEGEFYEPEESS